MSKYIDVNKLKAKIDSFMDNLWKVLPDCSNVEAGELSVREASDLGAYKALESVTYMIDSLQQEQPEVNEHFFFDEIMNVYDSNGCLPPRDGKSLEMLEIIARHFAEWGATHLNARKEE